MQNNLADIYQSICHMRQNVSPNTILSYRNAFVQYIEFMRDKKGIKVEKLRLENFTKDNVLCFLNHLTDEKHCSAKTKESASGRYEIIFNMVAIC